MHPDAVHHAHRQHHGPLLSVGPPGPCRSLLHAMHSPSPCRLRLVPSPSSPILGRVRTGEEGAFEDGNSLRVTRAGAGRATLNLWRDATRMHEARIGRGVSHRVKEGIIPSMVLSPRNEARLEQHGTLCPKHASSTHRLSSEARDARPSSAVKASMKSFHHQVVLHAAIPPCSSLHNPS